MAYTNSKLVVHTKLSPNHSGQRTHSIDRISPHCVVGQVTAESLGNLFARASYQASSNYGIDKDGRVGLYVEEKNRSWCTSSNANDQRAVTIECASDTSSPYRMNDAVYQTLIKLCTDICRRNGKKKLLWFGDKNKTLNYSPAADEMIITVHRWFANKSCPGDWLYSRLGDLANKVTAELGGSAAPVETEVMLGKGDWGGAVEEMQKMLIACGYSCGSCGADGIFGNNTLKALETFQKDSGLAVDGIYGPKSKAALIAQSQSRGKTDTKPYTEAFIEKVAPMAQADQKANGILASITLAQAILESGWGRSELAVNANNLFGMKKSLSDTANGKLSGKERISLETYVQSAYFERIIQRANTRLMVMSNGQYELRRRTTYSGSAQSGLELNALDHYNGTERDVRSLSGGEQFKASLSLALGLSDEIQESAGGIQLDTMFVDEGFGSLDESSLQQALKALNELTEGNRLIGIISHVADLKKIDRQIIVTKDNMDYSRITYKY